MPTLDSLSIPLSLFLIVYVLFAIFYLANVAFSFYHLMHYGLEGTKAVLLAGVHVAVSLLLFAFGSYFVLAADWSERIEVSDFLGSSETLPGL
jgi:hypothetical protein